jgi:hypothetical protein
MALMIRRWELFNDLRTEEVLAPGFYAKTTINGDEFLLPVVTENMTEAEIQRGIEAGVMVEVE